MALADDDQAQELADRQAAEIERCRREIAKIETLIMSGHPDVQGLCLALNDWNAEMKLCGGLSLRSSSNIEA